MRIFVLRSKLFIMFRQSEFCNLSPNVFDESPLMFQAKKDNFLELFGEVDITLSKI